MQGLHRPDPDQTAQPEQQAFLSGAWKASQLSEYLKEEAFVRPPAFFPFLRSLALWQNPAELEYLGAATHGVDTARSPRVDPEFLPTPPAALAASSVLPDTPPFAQRNSVTFFPHNTISQLVELGGRPDRNSSTPNPSTSSNAFRCDHEGYIKRKARNLSLTPLSMSSNTTTLTQDKPSRFFKKRQHKKDKFSASSPHDFELGLLDPQLISGILAHSTSNLFDNRTLEYRSQTSATTEDPARAQESKIMELPKP